ncbi:MAG TPA: acyl-CoA dehydrogenase [Planctomycetota bacterium]|nr:acyl-CoA dehydrogenase [Planctomycetota bacterium]
METTQVGALALSDDEQMLRGTIRRFAEDEVLPGELERDKKAEFHSDLVKKLAELGLLGIPVPEEYGGAGMSTMCYVLTVEEIAKVSGSLALTLAAHTSLGTMPIVDFGSDEQKRTFVPPLARGDHLGAFGLTEPGAGSDSGATKTSATREGDDYVISGQKAWITNAGEAGSFVVTARTSAGRGTEGISAFIVRRDTKGFSVGKPEKKLGLHSSDSRPIYFDHCRVPANQRLGPEGEGFKYFMRTLDRGRIIIGSMALGLAEGALARALQYAKERKTFGREIANHQAIAFKLADMTTGIEAARHLIYHAARRKDAGLPFAREAAMAKLFASEMAMRVTSDAIQIHGGYGFTREYHVERMYRDAKLCTIGEGTSEVQRLVISRSLVQEGLGGA